MALENEPAEPIAEERRAEFLARRDALQSRLGLGPTAPLPAAADRPATAVAARRPAPPPAAADATGAAGR